MEYKCHSLQLSKMLGEKIKAHHDVINKTKCNSFIVDQNT